jgi:hypothetical protein|tara:strand:- start:118 stop:408 length:291 start_codon:yes stop_codon:yes gene_type:complete
MGLKELINKGLDKATDKGSFFEGDGLLNVFKKITSESKADYLKKLKKNGASEEELEREADRWDRANKKGTKKSKEEPVNKFRGGLMRKPKLAKRGF